MPKLIELKSDPEIFDQHWNNKKNFDMREIRNRNFKDGDILLIREFNRRTKTYSGREIVARAIGSKYGPAYNGLNEGHIIMSLHPVTIKTTGNLEPKGGL